MSASIVRKAAIKPGQTSILAARAELAEPRDRDRAVLLDDRRPALVVHAEDLHRRPSAACACARVRTCVSIPPGAGG